MPAFAYRAREASQMPESGSRANPYSCELLQSRPAAVSDGSEAPDVRAMQLRCRNIRAEGTGTVQQ
jgi:hypothetical protein